MYLSGEGFEKSATEMYVNQTLFNVFSNDLYWRSMIFLLKEAGDKTFMKYIDPTKSWGLPKARQECKEKLDNMKIRMLSIQYSLSICKEHIENKMHLGQIQQMIVYLEKLVNGSTVQPTTEHCKIRKAKPVSLPRTTFELYRNVWSIPGHC